METSRGNRPVRNFSLAAMIATAFLAGALAGAAKQEDFAKVTATAPKTVKAGGKLMAKVTFKVPDGFHIYAPNFTGTGVPTSFTLEGGPKGYKLLTPKAPAGDNLSGTVVMTLPIQVPASAHGKTKLAVKVSFQQCNDRICLPPKRETVTFVTTVK